MSIKFEWDERKNLANIRKHKVSFRQASRIFKGEVLSKPDVRKSYGEKRTVSYGAFDELVIVAVVHTDRSGVVRVISARPANRKERREYYDYCQKKKQN